MRSRPKEQLACTPAEVAEWIGLADESLLGPEPIDLPASTVGRLKKNGPLVELTVAEVGAVLRVSVWRVHQFAANPNEVAGGRPVLGYRQASRGGRRLIAAADLAAWIALTRVPPVRTTGVPAPSDADARRVAERTRKQHNLARG